MLYITSTPNAHHAKTLLLLLCVRRVLRLEAHYFCEKLGAKYARQGFSGRSTRHRLAQHSVRPECSARGSTYFGEEMGQRLWLDMSSLLSALSLISCLPKGEPSHHPSPY